MLYVKEGCPACEGGLLGFRRLEDGTLVLRCDECDATYVDPSRVTLSSARFAPSVDEKADPGSAVGLGRWATVDEVERAGWRVLVVGEYHPEATRK